MRVCLVVEYDGTNYVGWQVQPNGISVQQVIEETFKNVFGEEIKLVASGRTDSGVHATAQHAHFDTNLTIDASRICYGLNSKLPKDIKIVKSFEVAQDFHARYNTKNKTYKYSVYTSEIERPLFERFAVRVNLGLNVDKMREGARLIEGEHDFISFCASGSSVKSTVRTVYKIDILTDDEKIDFVVEGNGFLYNMVRIIVGTLLELGYGKIGLEDISNALSGKNRSALGKTMPAKGLCLVAVRYLEEK